MLLAAAHDAYFTLAGLRGWGLGFGVWGLGFGVWLHLLQQTELHCCCGTCNDDDDNDDDDDDDDDDDSTLQGLIVGYCIQRYQG